MKKIFTLTVFFLFLLSGLSAQEDHFRWASFMGGESADFGEGVTTDDQGNAYITGFFRGPFELFGTTIEPESIRNAMFMAKVSPEQELIWVVTAEADGTTGASGFKPYYHEGYVYLYGDFRGDATFFSADMSETTMSATNRSNFIAKYTENGMLEWVRSVSSSHSSGLTTLGSANNLVVDEEGSVYFTTQFRTDADIAGNLVEPDTGGTNFYAMVVKFDALGAYQWHWNTTHPGDDRGQSISITPDGNVLFAIRFSSAITIGEDTIENEDGGVALIEVEPDGAYVDHKIIYTGSNHSLGFLIFDITFGPDNKIYVAASHRTEITWPDESLTEPLSDTRNAMVIAKFNTGWELEKQMVIGNEDANDYVRALRFDSKDNFYIAGDFSGTLDFGNDVVIESNAGSQDGFIASFNTDLEAIWASSFGGTNREDVWGLSVSSNDDIYVVGRYMGVFEGLDQTAESYGSFDIFLLRFAELDSDASLASIYVDDEPLAEFDPNLRTYFYPVSATSDVPVIAATANSELATVEIEQAENVSGSHEERTAVITVTAENPDITATYKVVFHQPTEAPRHEYDWIAGIHGENANFGEGIAVDDEGNTYVTGFFRGPISILGTEIEPESTRNNMILAKISPEKELVWVVTAEADGTTGASGFKPAYHNGHVYLFGDFRGDATFFSADLAETSLSSATRANFVAKYTDAGMLEWVRSFSSSHAGGLVTTGSANNLVVDQEGSVYITTQFRQDVDIAGTLVEPGTGGTNMYALLVKLDALGAYQWHWNSNLPGDDRGEAVITSPDGNIVFAVRYNESLTVNDITTESDGGGIAIIEVTPDGNHVRDQHFSTAITNRAAIFGLGYDEDRSLYIGGHSRTHIQWDAHNMFTPVNEARTSAILIKLNPDWELQWARYFGNEDNGDNLRSLQVSDKGYIYVAGDFTDSIVFGEDLIIESNDGSQDGFIAAFSQNGEALWAEAFGGTAREDIWGMAVSSDDEIYIIGRFMGEFAAYDDVLTSAGSFDVFIMRYGAAEPLFDVTFNVNLDPAIEFENLKGFDPEAHHIFITGSLIGWQEPGDDPDNQVMTKTSDDPMTYSKTFKLPAGEYAYKYFSDLIGSGWEGGEWVGGTDRSLNVSADTIVEDIFAYRDHEVSAPVVEEIALSLYPNPANSTFTIETEQDISEVRVVDMLGQVVYRASNVGKHHNIDVYNMKNGLYFVQVSTAAGLQTKRLQVTR